VDFSIKLGKLWSDLLRVSGAPSQVFTEGFSVRKLSLQAKWLTNVMPGGFATSEEHTYSQRTTEIMQEQGLVALFR
jgi:hypothetical protein